MKMTCSLVVVFERAATAWEIVVEELSCGWLLELGR
jgi:hypothetical protein